MQHYQHHLLYLDFLLLRFLPLPFFSSMGGFSFCHGLEILFVCNEYTARLMMILLNFLIFFLHESRHHREHLTKNNTDQNPKLKKTGTENRKLCAKRKTKIKSKGKDSIRVSPPYLPLPLPPPNPNRYLKAKKKTFSILCYVLLSPPLLCSPVCAVQCFYY